MDQTETEDDDLVIVEVAREACNAFDPPMPADAVVIGRADTIHIEADATPQSEG